MSLVRWLRKNNTKIMAGVVIVLMVAFIGGSYIQQFAHRTGKPSEAVATYGQGKTITQGEYSLAHQELEVLKILRADAILRSQDLRSLLLGELLFPEQAVSAELVEQVRQLIQSSDLAISEKQINDIYRGNNPPAAYWVILNKEAEQAGFRVSTTEAGQALGMIIPKLGEGLTYQKFVNMLMQRQGISEDDILGAFSKLLSVMNYVKVACSDENVTLNQIAQQVSLENETMDVNFVRFDAKWFEKNTADPSKEQIQAQFEKYKAFSQGDINDSNPFGFGYKLPARVQLEYLAVKLDDVGKIISQPTIQEMEEHYQRNLKDFEMSYRSDPNDPNSPVLKKTRTFGEVADTVSKILTRNRINSKAESIMRQAKELTETKLQNANVEAEKMTSEHFKQFAGDYATAAKEVGQKFNIKVYIGKTGLLSPSDIQFDSMLGGCYVASYKGTVAPLVKVVFAVEGLGLSELGPFDPPKPKLYENIGPAENNTKKLMMLARIVEADKVSIPENVEVAYNNQSIHLDDANQPAEKMYSVKKNVIRDLRNSAALEVAKNKSAEFLELAKKDGWKAAAASFNKLYSPKDEPNAIKIQELTDLVRFSKEDVHITALQNLENPLAHEILRRTKERYYLLEKLYSLIPADMSNLSAPATFDFKPNVSSYCIKDLKIKRLNENEFEKLKANAVLKEDFKQGQNMSVVFLNPENIIKRMNFKWAKENGPSVHQGEPAPLPESEF